MIHDMKAMDSVWSSIDISKLAGLDIKIVVENWKNSNKGSSNLSNIIGYTISILLYKIL